MDKKYRYALLHFFESTPAPRYFGLIIKADNAATCPPVFRHLYAFQWIDSKCDLTKLSAEHNFDIENDENFEVSPTYYIGKRLKPEHVSPKSQFYLCDKNGSIKKTLVRSYMEENNLHLLIPYMASDMEYELFVSATEPKTICVSHYLMSENISKVSLNNFAENNFVFKYYDE